MKTVYLYKEYCDNNPYETELIKAFNNKTDAILYLKKSSESFFGLPFGEIEETFKFDDPAESFSQESICFKDDDGLRYWRVDVADIM